MTPAADAWGDYDPTICPICSRESCEEHLASANEDRDRVTGIRQPADDLPAKARTPRLRAQRAAEIIDAPPPAEIVEGVVWAGSTTVLVGESGAGKTFVALDLAAAVADGVSWHGRDAEAGSGVYLPFEGTPGLRLRALRERGDRSLKHLYVIRARDPLSPRVARDGEARSMGELAVIEALAALRDELAAEGRPPIRLVIVDTVRAAMTGSEDSSEHVSAFLRAVARILAVVPEAGLLLVHHAGWQDGESKRPRERGSSAWRGNVDGTLYLEAGEYNEANYERRLILRTLKVREGEIPPPLHLIRRRVDLYGTDRRGQPITSCLIVRDLRSRADRDAEQAEAVAEATRQIDLRVLQAIRDYPEATSARSLRTYLGLAYQTVQDAVARVLRAGWARAGKKRGEPYALTPLGESLISSTALTAPNGTEEHPSAANTKGTRHSLLRVPVPSAVQSADMATRTALTGKSPHA